MSVHQLDRYSLPELNYQLKIEMKRLAKTENLRYNSKCQEQKKTAQEKELISELKKKEILKQKDAERDSNNYNDSLLFEA